MTEAQHQINFIQWLNYHHPDILCWHTPNGEARTPWTGQKLKNMGVIRGVPDLFVPQYKLFIEFKNPKGKLSASQRWMKNKLISYNYSWITAYGFLDGIKKFKDFINGDSLQNKILNT